MAILVSDIQNRILSALDAEGSERYTFDQDIKPAINYAIDYAVTVFNSVFSQKKLSEEILKDLTFVGIWKASKNSRIVYDSNTMRADIWTIIAVYPKPVIESRTTVEPPNDNNSYYMPLESFLSSKYSAKRLTLEEFNSCQDNVFMAGSPSITCPDLKQYGWVNFSNYTGGYSLATESKLEISISPSVSNERVAIAYLRLPSRVTSITGAVSFPETMINFIVDAALRFISIKQNNNTTLYNMSQQDILSLTQLLS